MHFLSGDDALWFLLQARVERVRNGNGFPNYFGLQRFGMSKHEVREANALFNVYT